MKTYVLTVSRKFPSGHPKAGKLTEFVEKILRGEKIHTIRLNYPFWEQRFKQIELGKACLSLRYWEGRPYFTPNIEFLRLDKSNGIGLERFAIPKDFEISPENPTIIQLAKNDGLTPQELIDWFGDELKPHSEHKAIIHFSNFRYNNL